MTATSLNSIGLDDALTLLDQRIESATPTGKESTPEAVRGVNEVVELIQHKWGNIETEQLQPHDADSTLETAVYVEEQLGKRREQLSALGIVLQSDIVEPETDNAHEMCLATAIDLCLTGRSMFTSNLARVEYAAEHLVALWPHMRPEFKKCVMGVMLPLLRNVSFTPENFSGLQTGSPGSDADGANFLAQSAKRTASKLADAISAVGG